MSIKGDVLPGGINQEIQGVTTQTRAHPDDFNPNVLKPLLDNDVTMSKQLETLPSEALTFRPGYQIVESEHDAPFRLGDIIGRTLVNQIGKDGNYDYRTSPLFTFFGTGEIITTSVPTGTKAQKIVCNRTADSPGHFGARYELNIDRSKHYVAVAYLDNISCDKPVYFSLAEWKADGYYTIRKSGNLSKGNGMQYRYIDISPSHLSAEESLIFYFRGEGTAGAEFRIGVFALYEITQAEYEAIGSMKFAQVAEKYPYVDSLTNVTNPYAIVTGGNLLPSFYHMGAVNGAIVDIRSDYDIDLMTNSTIQFVGLGNMKVKHKTYRVDFDPMGSDVRCYFNEQTEYDATPIRQHEIDESGATIEIGDDTKYIGVFFGNMSATGSFKVKNPMLVPGTDPKPFFPQQRSKLAFETELAAHPVDGSNPDTLFMGDDGLPYVLEKWKKVTLEPSNFDNTTTNDQPDGFKQFSIELKQKNTTNHVALIKFDGTQLTHDTISAPLVKPDSFNVGSGSLGGYVWMTIANSDSGWGKDYEPSQDEIKAYFLGWKMYDISGVDPTAIGTYNRTDGLHKGWTPLQSFDGTTYEGGYTGSGTPSTFPNTSNTTYYQLNRTWQPYRLQYLKAKPTVEPVRNYELGAKFSAGSNMVEVGSGIVLREKVIPFHSPINGNTVINSTYPGEESSKVKHKVSEFLGIYKNSLLDNASWSFEANHPYAYGKQRLYMYGGAEYDPTAVCHITYTMLDPTLAAPISSTVAANLRGTVSDLVQGVGDVQRRLSVVENQKAEKDMNPPQWITPTLLSGWGSLGPHFEAGYRKENELVRFRGRVKGGTATSGTLLFKLPAGYRPKRFVKQVSFTSQGAQNTALISIGVHPTGEVYLYYGEGLNGSLFLDGISFPIDS
ncbi:hypothetical protein M5W83_20120 [Paenibacillus thiaminolyticus]|uniref:Uncharacterized protein n=1 Tax=Paenibacillus thiaminolyticus TaxID=49283 RepID=A0AAP9DTA7_PANTH|nr:hypothetical protein [Paenibacillus thiaminolyticus]MCY9537341.1 hypothetical protein [Paenibacillus thiaminolyticus]MCY9601014.1 hypothetical protein [Paenibacillus thiaminolyticus]MCY9609459.1 hypothetical protein [Paenibacillus thiaminolyticus]MCY9613267.1 hypothetical protein [Paenibacillus thiaminolyticus]MCY9617682.1 hypothetical protein [Paenibacillus thiaminolyticus]